MDIRSFMRKFILDMKDAQLKDGKLPAIVPYCSAELMYNNTGGSVGWNDAGILVPYRFYKQYGDRRISEDNYDLMKGVADYMIKNAVAIKNTDMIPNITNTSTSKAFI